MKSDDMLEVSWTADMEIDLFYAMMDHKPVGENKHFHMIFIYEKYNNLNEKKLSVSQIWDHLKTLYDLNSLNENDATPFPAEQVDFALSVGDFGPLLKSSSSSPEENKSKRSYRKTDKYDFESQELTEDNSSNDSCTNDNDSSSVKKSSNAGEDSLNSDDESILSAKVVRTPKSEVVVKPKRPGPAARASVKKRKN